MRREIMGREHEIRTAAGKSSTQMAAGKSTKMLKYDEYYDT